MKNWARLVIGAWLWITPVSAGGFSQLHAGVNGAASEPATQPYRLEAGDTVEIRFFFNPELNDTIQIRPDGRVSLQLAGEAALAGKTVAQAADEIQTLYAHELKTPRVSLQVKSYAGQKVYVTGEVPRPGSINLPGDMSVFAAIADAGGIKITGNRDKIILVRKGPDGNPIIKPLVVRQKGIPTAEAYTNLHAYDVIMVPESRISRMDRWVDQCIKQLSPATMSAGFTYLYNTTSILGLPIQ